MRVFNITDFEALPGGQVNAAGAIQRAVDAAHGAGGGMVLVPPGQKFLCGSFTLKSNVQLHLAAGSVLLASPDIRDYINYQHLPLFAQSDFCRFWIFAHRAENITIDGPGTLDANSNAYIIEKRPENTVARNPRAQSVVFLGCRNVVLRDICIRNTPSWAVRPAGCDNVLIDGISILNDLGLVNSDGIDVDCSRAVRIANCHIEAGDDAISIKGRREIATEYGPCEDIVITGCTLESHCCAFRLGLESHVDFRRIVFAQSTIRRSHRGLAIDCRDYCRVEDVLFSDLVVETIHSHRVWWHEGEAIWICQVPYVKGGPVAELRNIVFRNIAITAEQGVYVQGADGEAPPQDILFDGVRVHLRKQTDHPAGFFDPRPNRPGLVPAGSRGVEVETPWGSLFQHDLPGFFFDRARGITLRNCRVTFAPGLGAPYSHALEAWATPNLVLEGFQGVAARPELPAVAIHP